MTIALTCCSPRQSVLDGTADFVVNVADLPHLTEAEAREFLDSNVLTWGMEFPQAGIPQTTTQSQHRRSACVHRALY